MTSPTTDRRFGLLASAAIKVPARAYASANITLHGLQTIDGVVLAEGDRVLCNGQTDASENGVYEATAGDWTRAVDANTNYDLQPGTVVVVTEGTTYSQTAWHINSASVNVGVSALSWVRSLWSSIMTLGFLQSGTGAIARGAQDKMRDIVSVLDFGATGDGITDDTAAIQAAVTAHKRVFAPPGTYRTTATIVLPDGAEFIGAGRQAVVEADGVDAFSIAQSVNGIVVRDLTIRSYGDPRLYKAIAANGVNGGTINNLFHSNLYLQGWAVGVYWAYVWSSTMDSVYTVNCNNGLRYYGQSANNSVSNCRLTVNGGNASIDLVPDGGLVGEGLVVSNSALTSGAYGIKSGTGFFSLHVSNCIIDLISDTAIYGTDVRDMRLSNNFMYAANYCVYLNALGVAVKTGCGIVGNKMRITGNGNAVHIASNNEGVQLSGNTITIANIANGVYCNAPKCSIDNLVVNNSGTGSAVYFDAGATGFQLGSVIDTGSTGTLVTGGTPFMQTQGIHTVTDTSGAGLVLTTNNPAYYDKAGNLCSMGFDITFPATVDATLVKLSLPFTGTSGGYAGAGVVGLTDYVGFVNIQASSGGAFLRLSEAGVFLTNANLSGKRIAGQIVFTTTA